MSCPFYYSFRLGEFYCENTREYVEKSIYRQFCRDGSFEECPIYQKLKQKEAAPLPQAITEE